MAGVTAGFTHTKYGLHTYCAEHTNTHIHVCALYVLQIKVAPNRRGFDHNFASYYILILKLVF